jgi:hypothetical protein
MVDRSSGFLGLSQTFSQVLIIPRTMRFSRSVNLLKSEEARKQIVLIVDCPTAGKAEAFSQPQHRLETSDCSPRGNDWKPPIFGMFFFTRKWSLSMPCWRCLVT